MSSTLLTVPPDETVLMAWELMTRASVHHLPVVTADGRCEGVLTDRDLAAQWLVGPLARQRRTVADLLGRRCSRVQAEDPLERIAEVMDRDDVDAVPVVDDAGRLRGLITWRDVIAVVAGRRRPRRPDETAAGSAAACLFQITPALPAPLARPRPS